MKANNIKTKICLLYIILAISLSVQAQKTKTLTIIHTNDVHSRVEPLDTQLPDAVAAGNGGFLRVAAYVNQLRQEIPDLLMFDSGDFSQGTPYYNLFHGDVEINLMNAIGYDAGTIGNHEFDFGLENMARLFRQAKFPIVCANYDFSGTILEDLVQPYTILQKNGFKIGVFGLGVNPHGLVQGSHFEGMKYLDTYERANEVAALLKKQGCDVVICLSHLGYRSSSKNRISDTDLVPNTRNIDMVLGGHSHTLLENPEVMKNLDGKDVYVSQMGKSGIYVGRMDLTFSK